MSTLIILAKTRYQSFTISKPALIYEHPNGNFLITEVIKSIWFEKFERILILCDPVVCENKRIQIELLTELFDEIKIEPEFFAVKTTTMPIFIARLIKNLKLKGSAIVLNLEHLFFFTNIKKLEENTLLVADIRKFSNLLVKQKVIINNEAKFTADYNNVIGNYVLLAVYFKDVKEYRYHKTQFFLKNKKQPSQISDVLNEMFNSGVKFDLKQPKFCSDISTLKKWKEYIEKHKLIFVTLDGILVDKKNKHLYNKWYEDEKIIEKNVRVINTLYQNGLNYIVILTSRPENEELIQLLKDFKIKYHRVVGDLPNYMIELINCYDVSHRNPTATAINLPKNLDLLKWSYII